MLSKRDFRIAIVVFVAAGIYFGLAGRGSLPYEDGDQPMEVLPNEGSESNSFPDSMDDYAGPVFGYFVMGPEVKTFVECGSLESTALWVDDQTDSIQPLYLESATSADEYEPVFGSVIMRQETRKNEGFGADYDQTGVVTGINYWPNEGFGCDYPWDTFSMRAFGNEPFWMMEISNATLILSRPDGPKKSWLMNMNESPFTSVDQEVRLEVTEKTCQDSMSGNRFGLAITLSYGDSRLKGCGMKGTGT